MATNHDDVLWLHAQGSVTLVELAETSGFPEDVLRELVEYGALAPLDQQAAQWAFNADCVARVRAAARLGHDLDLETHTLALVLSYLDRIEQLESQVRHLNAQLARPR